MLSSTTLKPRLLNRKIYSTKNFVRLFWVKNISAPSQIQPLKIWLLLPASLNGEIPPSKMREWWKKNSKGCFRHRISTINTLTNYLSWLPRKNSSFANSNKNSARLSCLTGMKTKIWPIRSILSGLCKNNAGTSSAGILKRCWVMSGRMASSLCFVTKYFVLECYLKTGQNLWVANIN